MTRFIWALSASAVYLILVGAFTPADGVSALSIGLVCSLLRPRRPTSNAGVSLKRLLATPRFLLGFTIEVVRGSIDVVGVLIGKKDWRKAGMVEAPLERRSRESAEMTGIIITAIPGSILVDVDEERQVMLISAIDASHPSQLRREWERFYQLYQKPVEP